MNSLKTIINIMKIEFKYQIKQPFIYIYIFVLLGFTIMDFGFLRNEPYDTKEKYENMLGNIPYEEFKDMDESDFYMKISGSSKEEYIQWNEKPYTAIVYENNLNLDEKLELSKLKDNQEQFIQELKTLEDSGKVKFYGVMDFNDIKKLSEEEYNSAIYSIYDQFSSGNHFTQEKVIGINTYNVNPTYEEVEKMLTKENMSEFIGIEYYLRLTNMACILGIFLIVFTFMKDYKLNNNTNIYSSSVKGYEYILGKFLAITLFMIVSLFLISFGYILMIKSTFKGTLWNFYLKDFIKIFLIIPCVTIPFFNICTILVTIISKDTVITSMIMFLYTMTYDGLNYTATGENYVNMFKPSPRIAWVYGNFTKLEHKIFNHQYIYITLTIIVILFSIYVWNRQRYKREGR
ncbi:hypothetical protein [Romboutsia sp. 1001713B170131_170501_G6]|uniref:hypothetical protein n=1 Tax=Romboutsia sp. 1001713B170131_170501_G6 TaxID=2787108 RepID=UPI0018AB95BE|nr:hypothetical protein [Romboutsia sp. 1001713B170131_170501_G6]